MARPKILTISPYAAGDADGICASQTPAAGGNQDLTINGALASGGAVTFDTPRQVLLTFAGDESARKFVIKGTSSKGYEMVEAVAGTATTAQTVGAFATVTSVTIDDDSAGAITVGTATVIWTNWIPLNFYENDFEVALGFAIGSAGGSPSLTVEMTLSDILQRDRVASEFDLVYPTHTSFAHSTMAAMAADTTGNIDFPVRAVRLKSNAVFTTGAVSLEVLQRDF